MKIVIELHVESKGDTLDILNLATDDLRYLWKRWDPNIGDKISLTDENGDIIGWMEVRA